MTKRVTRETVVDDAVLTEDIYMGHDSLEEAVAGCDYTSQAEALSRMMCRENVFITGPPGSGKSTVVKKFIDLMSKQFGGDINIAVTGTTGYVSSMIGGRTVHSWSGIGIGVEAKGNVGTVKDTDVLIIDEISMLPAYYLDLVEKVCRQAKKSSEPFGGIQVIFLGDFLQLPPVPNRELSNDFDQRFAVFSKAWEQAEMNVCYLDKIVRSKDPRLTRVLNDIAGGTVSQKTVDIIKSRMQSHGASTASTADTTGDDGGNGSTDKVYTKLYTLNKKVDKINQEELDKNPNVPFTFEKTIQILTKNQEYAREAEKAAANFSDVTIKVGAKVMVTKNEYYTSVRPKSFVPAGAVFVPNGSIGEVIRIPRRSDKAVDPGLRGSVFVRLNTGDIVAISEVENREKKYTTVSRTAEGKPVVEAEDILSVTYMPLKLAYAITVHKSQGQTLDGVSTDLRKCFSPGMGYVALSRVRSLDDLIVEGISKEAFRVNRESQHIDKVLRNKAKTGRKNFTEQIEDYETILSMPFARYVYWN